MPQNKRRGTQRQRKGDESGSDSADERSPDGEEPSLSPEVPSEPPSRRSSNVGRLPVDTGGGGSGYPSSLPPLSALSNRIRDRDADASSAGSSVRPKDSSSGGGSGMTSGRGYFPDGEVPHIATFLAYAEGSADDVNEKVVTFTEQRGVVPCGMWQDAEVPGWVVTELTCYETAASRDPVEVAGLVATALGRALATVLP